MSLLGQAEWTRVCLTGLVCPLMGKYSRLLFGLHHSHEDLRPIQWINYHQPERGKFELSLSYTGLIHLDHLPTFDDYLAWLSTVC